MEMNNEFIVFRHKENGTFVNEYKNRDSHLTFEATFTDEIQFALILEEEHYLRQKNELLPLCKALGCEPIRVKAEYTLETLDGQPAKEIEEKEDSYASELTLLKKMFGAD